jgi:integrase
MQNIVHAVTTSGFQPLNQSFLRRVKKYDLPRLTLHGLRHTWATLALERGIHPRVVQERFGHSTISITLACSATSGLPSTTRRQLQSR